MQDLGERRAGSTARVRLTVGILLLCGLLLGCSSRLPNTPLLVGLDDLPTHDDRQALLLGRIEARHRVGAPEAGLEAYLRSQGFKTSRRTDVGAPEQPIYAEAKVTYGWRACPWLATVHWRGDTAGRISELHVNHGVQGCES